MSLLSDLGSRSGCDACVLHMALAACDAVFLASPSDPVVGRKSGVNAAASTRAHTEGQLGALACLIHVETPCLAMSL